MEGHLAGPPESSSHRLGARVAATADRLRIDAATAEVVAAFDAAGVECRLLKGRSVDLWLFPDGDRLPYLDADLLVRPGYENPAAEALRRLGFELRFEDDSLPDWWREHHQEWWRGRDGVVVELHRTIVGVGADAAALWAEIAVDAEQIDVAGRPVATLAVPARALLVALHAAQHGSGGPSKAIPDLTRALEIAADVTWREAAALAERLDATDAFAAGLRLLPAGERLAMRLGLPAGSSVDAALRSATAPSVALGIEQLARAHGWQERAEILRHKLVPPPAFIRHWWPPAARNSWMLMLGYAYRPIWLVCKAPAGLRAWRTARRRVRRGR